MRHLGSIGRKGTTTLAVTFVLLAFSAARGDVSPDGVSEVGPADLDTAHVVSSDRGDLSSAAVSAPDTPASSRPEFTEAYISGRMPVGAVVDVASDRKRGTAGPFGGVAGGGAACTCDLDCADGDACTDNACDPNTNLCLAPTPASLGTLCGFATSGNWCEQDTCDGGGVCVFVGPTGTDPCAGVAGTVCDPANQVCNNCGGGCAAQTNAIFCLTGACMAGRCQGESDCTVDEFCDTDGIANGTCAPDTNARCCADIEVCAATTPAACDNGGGAYSGNYAQQMPFDDCTCPKYSSGINDNDGADLIWQISATEQPCTLFNRVGDDYTIENGSFLLLETFRFIGGIDTDGTGDGTVVFEFYDGSTTPPLLVFAAAVGFDPDPVTGDRGNNLWQITLTTPTAIPPVGYFVMRPGTGSGETVNLLSANAFGLAGLNNPDLMWVNDGPAAFLSPDDPDIMAFELVGTKTPDPLGGCCDPLGIAPCADTTQWVCEDLGYTWVGGMLCVSDPCGSGACCAADGGCTIDSPGNCSAGGGTFQGPGTSCDPNCCDQPATGADMCDGVTIVQIAVPSIGNPAVTTTITGDATTASDGTCSGSGAPCRTNNAAGWTCPGGETCDTNGECNDFANDPLWWEAFHIDASANVVIDYCCTDEGEADGAKGVRYIVLSDGCDPPTSSCGDSTFRTADASACADGNPGDLWAELPSGTWYIPIYADNHCSGSTTNCFDDAGCPAGETCVSGATPYQLHITVEPLPLGGCCIMVDGVTQGHCVGGIDAGQVCTLPADCTLGTCVFEVAPACIPFIDAPACEALGGVPIDNTTCTGAPCDGVGACCLEGTCLETTPTECELMGGDFLPGAVCGINNPCPTCEIADAAHCQFNDGGFIVPSDRLLGVRWADDFRPTAAGPINRVCWWPCWFNPTLEEECSDEALKPPDDFIVRWYEDIGGLPGAELGVPGGEALTPDATSPIDGNRCWNYSAPVTTPPIVMSGECYWIEITGLGDAAAGGTGCTVYWNNSNTVGNNSYSLYDQDGVYTGDDIQTAIGDELSDMSFCVDSGVIAGGCTHLAACCLPDLSCQDDMSYPDCQAAGGVFKPGEVCTPFTCPPACGNGNCVDAYDLNSPGYCDGGLDCTFPFTNAFCDPRVVTIDCPVDTLDLGSDKWYTWTAQPGEGGPIEVTMCDQTSYDAAMVVYDGGAGCSACPGDLDPAMVCGDDTCGVGGGPPQVEFDAVEGNCYFLRIGGWNGEQGSGAVTIRSNAVVCDTPRPLPDDCFELEDTGLCSAKPCDTTADCLVGINANSEVECILGEGGTTPGVCYVYKNRYVSIDPNPANTGRLTARRITLDLGAGQTQVLGWVGPPVERPLAGPEVTPQLLSRIVSVPHYRDWSVNDQGQPWTDHTVNVGDCATSPGWTYIIQAIDSLCDESVEAHYSEALVLNTVANFGDVTGGVVRQPPDTNRNFKDINAIVRGFQSVQKEPKVWLDLVGPLARPECPDFSDISFSDINHVVSGFGGGNYPYPPPTACPPNACPYP